MVQEKANKRIKKKIIMYFHRAAISERHDLHGEKVVDAVGRSGISCCEFLHRLGVAIVFVNLSLVHTAGTVNI